MGSGRIEAEKVKTASKFNSLETLSGKRNSKMRRNEGSMEAFFLKVIDFTACLCTDVMAY